MSENARLTRENAELRRQLGRSSENSGLPPSTDSHTDRSARAARKRVRPKSDKRRKGGQPGHPGKTLEKVDNPDVIVEHRPANCDGCGGSLDDAEMVSTEVRQVFDVPDPCLVVTEHHCPTLRCGCGAETAGVFPPGAIGTTCWGRTCVGSLSTCLSSSSFPTTVAPRLWPICWAPPSQRGRLPRWCSKLPELVKYFV